MKIRLANAAGAEWFGMIDGSVLSVVSEDSEHSRRTIRQKCKTPGEAAERLASLLEGAYQRSAVPVDLTGEQSSIAIAAPLAAWPMSAYRMFVRADGLKPSLLADAAAFADRTCKAAGVPVTVKCLHNDGMGPRVVVEANGSFASLTFGFADAAERRALRPHAVEQLMLFGNGYGNELLLGPDGKGYGFCVLHTKGELVDLPLRLLLSHLMLSGAVSVQCLLGVEYAGVKVFDPLLGGFDWRSHKTDVETHLARIGFSKNADPAVLLFAATGS